MFCSKCGQDKPTDLFYKRNGIKRGYAYLCKPCIKPLDTRTKEDQWERKMKSNYGIDKVEYERMLEEQGGKCALCGDAECQSGKRFAVDHCHETGVVRAILCYNCNTGLGKFRDDPEVLRKAAELVERFK
jgi:hypothetical protein